MKATPGSDSFKQRVQASFDRQQVMQTFAARITRIEAGTVELRMPFHAEFTQQHGFMHAGIVATLLDSACGYAAFSLMAEDKAVLTVEYKINLLRPADGNELIARGWVIRSGKTLTVCQGEAFANTDATEKQLASMQATVMAVRQQKGLKQ